MNVGCRVSRHAELGPENATKTGFRQTNPTLGLHLPDAKKNRIGYSSVIILKAILISPGHFVACDVGGDTLETQASGFCHKTPSRFRYELV